MAPKMGEGGQIWLKCNLIDLIMMIRYKNDIFERVKKNHADLAWNYPFVIFVSISATIMIIGNERLTTDGIIWGQYSCPPLSLAMIDC